MKIRNYTQEELDYIKLNYNNMTVRELALELNKSEGSIGNAVRKMGLIKQPHKPWTDEEIQYLKNNYIDKTSEEIAKYLNRSLQSINAERDTLGLIRNEAWRKEEVNYIIDNFKSMTHEDMGKNIGRTESAVRAKCFDLGLYKKDKPWEDWELEFVKNNYMEMSKTEISEILNRSNDAIQVKANRMGLKKSPYFCNYHYFDEIDTEEKAYWLGFLTADGWISKSEKTGSGVVGIELQYGDINHLKKFNKSLSGNYQITDRWRPCKISTKDSEKKHHSCVIRIFSLIMYNALESIGFSNNKSYDFSIPELRQDLVRHYLRGYFDGDGCLCFTNNSFHINFTTASKKLNDDVSRILRLENFSFSENNYINNFDTCMYKIEIFSKSDKLRFLDWIYQDACIYLDRKYKKYLKVKNMQYPQNGLAV